MTDPEVLTGPAAVADLLRILDLERIEVDIFRGESPQTPLQRAFGGLVAGQSLVAAVRTVEPERLVHSLHGYFLRPGDPVTPIVYEVDRIRDGRSFTTRRVVGIQHGRAIFNMQASFQLVEEGLEHQLPMPTGVPDPESLPTWQQRFAPLADRLGDFLRQPRPIDVRYVKDPPWLHLGQATGDRHNQVWIRAAAPLPDDPVLHTIVLTYASDLTLLDSVMAPHGLAFGANGTTAASLDHAVWFHRPFRADEWLLYDQESTSASGGRGLAKGNVFTRDGALVASVVQEGLVRVRR